MRKILVSASLHTLLHEDHAYHGAYAVTGPDTLPGAARLSDDPPKRLAGSPTATVTAFMPLPLDRMTYAEQVEEAGPDVLAIDGGDVIQSRGRRYRD
ncbi:hypothetical protein PV331_34440 [Streptomyces sp. WI04-05B]|nr:hypothetical protein [Streptomyces sp. WI04-05B]